MTAFPKPLLLLPIPNKEGTPFLPRFVYYMDSDGKRKSEM